MYLKKKEMFFIFFWIRHSGFPTTKKVILYYITYLLLYYNPAAYNKRHCGEPNSISSLISDHVYDETNRVCSNLVRTRVVAIIENVIILWRAPVRDSSFPTNLKY